MQFYYSSSQRTRVLLVSAVLSLLFIATACVGQSASAAPTTTPSTPYIMPADNSQQVKEALVYLQSSDRAARFTSIVPKAGLLIAKELEGRPLDQLKRYDDYKRPLIDNYVGWGGISSLDNGQFAWVFWNRGTIDYTKPITQIGINHVSGRADTNVLMFAPTSDNPSDKLGSYWQIFLSTTADTTDVTDIINIESTPRDSNSTNFRYPRNLDGLKALDESGFRQLMLNMESRFGTDWNK